MLPAATRNAATGKATGTATATAPATATATENATAPARKRVQGFTIALFLLFAFNYETLNASQVCGNCCANAENVATVAATGNQKRAAEVFGQSQDSALLPRHLS